MYVRLHPSQQHAPSHFPYVDDASYSRAEGMQLTQSSAQGRQLTQRCHPHTRCSASLLHPNPQTRHRTCASLPTPPSVAVSRLTRPMIGRLLVSCLAMRFRPSPKPPDCCAAARAGCMPCRRRGCGAARLLHRRPRCCCCCRAPARVVYGEVVSNSAGNQARLHCKVTVTVACTVLRMRRQQRQRWCGGGSLCARNSPCC